MLDADADEVDWREVARILLHIDPDRQPDRARRAFESHLDCAKWIARHGYRQLLRMGRRLVCEVHPTRRSSTVRAGNSPTAT